jgi:hypothetical protein
LLGLLLGLAACDSAPGPVDLNPRPPVLSDFSFGPEVVNTGQLPEGWQATDDGVSGPVTVSVTASDPDGTVDEVRYVVQSPTDPTQPLALGLLESTGGNGYEASVPLTLPPGAVGNYTVLVFAIDDDRVQSGEARGLLRFSASGEPPVIENVEADPEVVRPGQDTTLRFVVTVSDPDGLENIGSVFVTTPNGQTESMFDDGQSQGDEAAGDGQYTAQFDVPDSVTPGTQTFSFQAFDRSGLASEVVTKDIQIAE